MLFLVYETLFYTDGRICSRTLKSVRLSFDAAIIDADGFDCATIDVPGRGTVYVAHSIYYARQLTEEDQKRSRELARRLNLDADTHPFWAPESDQWRARQMRERGKQGGSDAAPA